LILDKTKHTVTKVECVIENNGDGATVYVSYSSPSGAGRDSATYVRPASHSEKYDEAWCKEKVRLVSIRYFEADMYSGDPIGPEPGGPPSSNPGTCASILNNAWCEGSEGQGIYNILNLVITIMTFGIAIAGTLGLVISGIQYMTARDNEQQVQKAKSRIFNVVIGMLVYALMWLVLNWLIPGGMFN
jgi:hypothetical protein